MPIKQMSHAERVAFYYNAKRRKARQNDWS